MKAHIIILMFIILLSSFASGTTVVIQSETEDGQSGWADTSWLIARDSTSGETTVDNGIWIEATSSFGEGLYHNKRGFLYFDTSSLPDTAIISNVTINLVESGFFKPTYNLSLHTSGVSGSLVDSDYDECGPTINISEVDSLGGSDPDARLDFTFNQTGIDFIDVAGITVFCIRQYENDLLNVSPTNSSKVTYLASANAANPANKPNITITYTLPASAYTINISFKDPTPSNATVRTVNYIEANVTFNASEGIDYINITLYKDGVLYAWDDGNTLPLYNNFTSLPNGEYQLNATAYDLLSNTNSTETRYITINVTTTTEPTEGNLYDPDLYLSLDELVGVVYEDIGAGDTDFNITNGIKRSEGCLLGNCSETLGLGASPNSRLSVIDPQFLFSDDDRGMFSFWINTSTDNVHKAIFINRNKPSGYMCTANLGIYNGKIMIDIDTNNIAACPGADDDSRDMWTSDITVNDGAWHHIVWGSDGENYTVYIDGIRRNITEVPVGTNTEGRWFNNIPYQGNARTEIGGWTYLNEEYYMLDASYDEFSYYPFVLTGPNTSCSLENSSQVCQLYNDGNGFNPMNLSNIVIANATILPANPTNGTQLNGYCNVSTTVGTPDMRLDASWSLNSVPLYTYLNITTETSPFTINLSQIPAENVTAGDTWTFRCRATNIANEETSGWVTSEDIKIISSQKTAFNFTIIDSLTGVVLYDADITVTNSTTYSNTTNTTFGTARIVVPQADTYTILVISNGYTNRTVSESISVGQHKLVTIALGSTIQANIYDEIRSGINGDNYPFDISVPSNITFTLFCVNESIKEKIKINPYDFQLDCDYRIFEIKPFYNNSVSYYRRFIEDSDLLNSTGSFNAYLIDATVNPYVTTTFKLVDFSNTLKNIKVIIKKVINDETVVISADYANFNTVIAYLAQHEQYIIEIEADNSPTIFVGYYTPITSETKYLSLYDLSLAARPTGISGVDYASWISNSTGSDVANLYYNDTDATTTSYNWSLYLNSTDGPLLYSIVSPLNDVLLQYAVPLVYENTTIITKLHSVVRDVRVPDYIITIQYGIDDDISLGLFEYYGLKWTNFIITIILGMVLIYMVNKKEGSAGIALFTIGIMAAFFRFIKFQGQHIYTLHPASIALIIIIGIILLLKKGEKE